jgi:hypothetical protein
MSTDSGSAHNEKNNQRCHCNCFLNYFPYLGNVASSDLEPEPGFFFQRSDPDPPILIYSHCFNHVVREDSLVNFLPEVLACMTCRGC